MPNYTTAETIKSLTNVTFDFYDLADDAALLAFIGTMIDRVEGIIHTKTRRNFQQELDDEEISEIPQAVVQATEQATANIITWTRIQRHTNVIKWEAIEPTLNSSVVWTEEVCKLLDLVTRRPVVIHRMRSKAELVKAGEVTE